MTEPLQFGENALVPSRAYAEGWPAFARQRWELILASYRERVGTLYEELAEQHPDCFDLLQPLEIRIVISRVKEWIFTKPADADHLVLEERWEDPLLSHRDMYKRADHERVVRDIAGVSDSYELFKTEELSMRFDLGGAPNVGIYNPKVFGREHADLNAGTAIAQPKWQKAIDELMGRSIDEEALARLRSQLEVVAELQGTRRGNRFETWFGELLAAHRCEVEPGVTRDGEQIDFFVHKPFRAVIECRWKQDRLQPRELADLTAKLSRRPAIIAGIYVSWSGFTDACRGHAAQEPNGKTVLLWDSSDIKRLLSGQVHALELFEEHVSDRVRRYKLGH